MQKSTLQALFYKSNQEQFQIESCRCFQDQNGIYGELIDFFLMLDDTTSAQQ